MLKKTFFLNSNMKISQISEGGKFFKFKPEFVWFTDLASLRVQNFQAGFSQSWKFPGLE